MPPMPLALWQVREVCTARSVSQVKDLHLHRMGSVEMFRQGQKHDRFRVARLTLGSLRAWSGHGDPSCDYLVPVPAHSCQFRQTGKEPPSHKQVLSGARLGHVVRTLPYPLQLRPRPKELLRPAQVSAEFSGRPPALPVQLKSRPEEDDINRNVQVSKGVPEVVLHHPWQYCPHNLFFHHCPLSRSSPARAEA